MKARLAAWVLILAGPLLADDAPVADLVDVAPVRAWFEEEAGHPRLVLLLSPT